MDTTFNSPYLQGICDTAVTLLGTALRSHRFISSRDVVFEIVTNETRLRTQYVDLSLTDGGNADLVITSRVGTIFQLDHALLALKMAHQNPFANVCVDEDNNLQVRTAWLHATSATATEVALQIGAVARLADALEEAIFGWDHT